MERVDYVTKRFKDIFPSYVDFRDYLATTGLYESYSDIPTLKTFTLIAFKYNDSHVFSSEESFKQHFAIDIYTYSKEFEATTKVIDEMMELTDSQIATADEMITNIANIPETVNSTNVEEVDFITTQQKNINKKGVLQIKREQLSNKRTYTVKTFLNRFRHLFIKVLSPAYNYVVCEEDEQ